MSLLIKVSSFEDQTTANAVYRILCVCDKEFYPPLSSRDSSVSTSFAATNSTGSPDTYFTEMKNQALLTCHEAEAIVGFMSFRHSYKMSELGKWTPANYITTVCVDPNQRGKGVCSAFYVFMLNRLPLELKSPFTATRTWSLNGNHLRLLEKLNFTLVKKLSDDRGPGVDTVYFARETAA